MSDELTVSRVIDAPREEVFRAWTDPEEIKRWFGPGEFKTPEAEVDLRPGGSYRFVMQAPDGNTMPVIGAPRPLPSARPPAAAPATPNDAPSARRNSTSAMPLIPIGRRAKTVDT